MQARAESGVVAVGGIGQQRRLRDLPAGGVLGELKRAFGARERMRMEGPEGKIGHAELEIGNSLVMLSDPFPQEIAERSKAAMASMS